MKAKLNRLLSESVIDSSTAKAIGDFLGVDWDKIDILEFTAGINVEMEHGKGGAATDVVRPNDFMSFGRIALVHLEEVPDYYTRLKKYVENGK